MKITQAQNTQKRYRYLDSLIASKVLYLNWLAEREKEMRQNLDKARNNGKK